MFHLPCIVLAIGNWPLTLNHDLDNKLGLNPITCSGFLLSPWLQQAIFSSNVLLLTTMQANQHQTALTSINSLGPSWFHVCLLLLLLLYCMLINIVSFLFFILVLFFSVVSYSFFFLNFHCSNRDWLLNSKTKIWAISNLDMLSI